MKLFHMQASPNCRRVRILLAEKGITLPAEDVLEPERMALKEEYLALYSFRLVPMLQLDDGRQIGESIAICRYFEELYPEPDLFGRDAVEKAIVEMWQQRVQVEGELGAEEMLRNSHPAFVDRGLQGCANAVPQISALVERGRGRLNRFYQVLECRLEQEQFIAGRHFSVADISALCAVDFAKWSGVEIPETARNMMRWYKEVSSRPSASA